MHCGNSEFWEAVSPSIVETAFSAVAEAVPHA